MAINIRALLLAFSVICFTLDALGVSGRVKLTSLGMACFVASFLTV